MGAGLTLLFAGMISIFLLIGLVVYYIAYEKNNKYELFGEYISDDFLVERALVNDHGFSGRQLDIFLNTYKDEKIQINKSHNRTVTMQTSNSYLIEDPLTNIIADVCEGYDGSDSSCDSCDCGGD